MAKRKYVNIYTQVGDFEPVFLEKVLETDAQAIINRYERADRYEAEVEGYGFPYGLPNYFVA